MVKLSRGWFGAMGDAQMSESDLELWVGSLAKHKEHKEAEETSPLLQR